MSPSRREFDETDALRAATEVFWRHGFRNTSMEMLCGATGLGRQSIYTWVGDKRGLFLACLKHYIDETAPPILRRMAGDGADGLDSVLEFVGLWTAWAQSDDCIGCLVSTAMNEFARSDADVSAILCDFDAFVVDALERALTKAVDQGSVRADLDPRVAAETLGLMRHGFMIAGRAASGRGAAEAAAFVEQALR